MYGLSEDVAQTKAAELNRRNDGNRYEVAAHSWTAYGNYPLTWGVVRYVPYCDAMPWRHDGFVWFPRNFSTLSPR
jgi:hypothetical protein